MKKLSKYLLMGAVALGMVACNNEEIDTPTPTQGNTHVSVTLRLSSSGTNMKALPNDYNYLGEWAGKDKITAITVYLVDGSSVNSTTFSVGLDATTDYTISTTGGITLMPNASAAIKTTAGQKKVYVVVNETLGVNSWLNKTSVHEFEQAYEGIAQVLANSGTNTTVSTSASKLATINGASDETIVMTNVAPATLDVQPNISAEQTITAVNQNRASLQVERAVARAMVTIKEATSYAIPDPNTSGVSSLGTLTDLTWVVAQGENSLYVQRKSTWETPNHGWIPGVGGADFVTEAGDKYDYSGLFENQGTGFGGTTVPTYADYESNKNDDPIELETRWLDGKFVLPTTHAVASAPTNAGNYSGGYRKGNTAYVLVRAKFTPAAGAWADAGAPNTNGTFYVGKNGKFYTSSQAAYDDTGSIEMTKYEEGKVLYYAWLNPDQTPNWYNSPVLRNNIYHIHITGFKNLGTNWNPLYPEDPSSSTPNNPDPKPVPEDVTDPADPTNPITPTEPTNPIDPTDPLTTSETWMSVDVTVLPWLVHSYEVNLGI